MTRFIKEVVPDAQVEARRVDRVEIKVFLVEGGAEKSVFSSAQREFFGKNGHRGKKPLQGTFPCMCLYIHIYTCIYMSACSHERMCMMLLCLSN